MQKENRWMALLFSEINHATYSPPSPRVALPGDSGGDPRRQPPPPQAAPGGRRRRRRLSGRRRRPAVEPKPSQLASPPLLLPLSSTRLPPPGPQSRRRGLDVASPPAAEAGSGRSLAGSAPPGRFWPWLGCALPPPPAGARASASRPPAVRRVASPSPVPPWAVVPPVARGCGHRRSPWVAASRAPSAADPVFHAVVLVAGASGPRAPFSGRRWWPLWPGGHRLRPRVGG